MKATTIKRILFSAIAASVLASGSALAGLIPTELVYSYKGQNSGMPGVISMLEQELNKSYSNSDLTSNKGPKANRIDGMWVIDFGQFAPEYVLLNFGVGNTATGFHDTYLFNNKDGLTQLVFSDAQVGNITNELACPTNNGEGCGIGRLSHYVLVGGASVPGQPESGSTPVPEPASVVLMGAGLAALTLFRRRRQAR